MQVQLDPVLRKVFIVPNVDESQVHSWAEWLDVTVSPEAEEGLVFLTANLSSVKDLEQIKHAI